MKVRFPLHILTPQFHANTPLGEGHFDQSEKPSGAATPVPEAPAGKKKKGLSKKAKTAKQRLAVADGEV